MFVRRAKRDENRVTDEGRLIRAIVAFRGSPQGFSSRWRYREWARLLLLLLLGGGC